MSYLKEFMEIFGEISRIPRCSGNEKLIAEWIMKRADDKGFKTKTDKTGNICVKVDTGSNNTVVIQNHMDMVCEKESGARHDFSKDPIKMTIKDDWLKAECTTLGADNGAGMALAFLLSEENSPKPNLELLFTVDEERGLVGASGLEEDMLTGRTLINLDTETEGEFIIGCAGGRDTLISKKYDFINFDTAEMFKLEIKGLEGGHSGLDIHKGRPNALKMLGEMLGAVNKNYPVYISDINGGTAHNAIPRSAFAEFMVEGEITRKNIEDTLAAFDTGLFDLKTVKNSGSGFLTQDDSVQIVSMINEIPHGVYSYDSKMPDKVETSSNLATIKIENSSFTCLVSQRSSNPSNLNDLTALIEDCALKAGAEYETGNEYPGWLPEPDSEIVRIFKNTYSEICGIAPKVDVVHAGLECGVIGEKFENMEMISLGPTIIDAHSPAERLSLSSVEKVVRLLKRVFEKIA
ncbi:beta-Ala-His dipeptidase [Flexistipes sp.]|uniref:beta-Ala-His dipeptidase n=1 Tax=Flexistipes sp. TaxID=3088135 RepID=UPI002E2223D3|nr:beta-Ala-His dipeptidase [Flexistipes sp.]